MLFGKKPYEKITDGQLMQLLTSGDAQAFNQLYFRYKNRLLYYFYRMLYQSEEKAQDFTQELFYKILEKPYLFDSKRNFSTWIFSIAHNMCKNEYRRLEVRKNTTLHENLDEVHEPRVKNKNNKQLIEKIFIELENESEGHRSCFLLKYREGFNIDEISEILGVSKGTVKSRLHYTRKKMQEKFTDLYYEL